jgi:indole-3-glycerol phosphate synthase
MDLSLSERLRKLVPPEIIFVSESGISRAEDIARLRKINAHAALIGESIMRAPDKIAAIKNLRG